MKRVIPAHAQCSFPSSPPALLACLQLSRTCILGKAWEGGSRLIITTAKFPTAEKIRNVNHPQSDMSKHGCQANGTDISYLQIKKLFYQSKNICQGKYRRSP